MRDQYGSDGPQGARTVEQLSATTSSGRRARWLITFGALALVGLHLGWELMQGGVASHHLLARADMPAIWNGWALVLVPALAWWVAGRVLRRPVGTDGGGNVAGSLSQAMPGFLGSLIYGALLAASFALGLGWEQYLFLGLFVIGLVLPIYRAECILGFVLGMMVTFGGILPMLVSAVVGAFSWLAHALYRAAIRAARRHSRG